MKDEVINYKLLWVNIMKQAVKDLQNDAHPNRQREAYKYIFIPNKDFGIASDMLGVHPNRLREQLVELFLNEEEL